MTIVCGDSHTATHGAFGALAFGIGTSEVEHVLATQTLAQRKPKSMVVRYSGELGFGVTAKDLILGTIGQMGTDGAAGHVVEFAGPVIEGLSMEGRMTVCNMTIEGGGRAGMVAPDDMTFEWFSSGAPALRKICRTPSRGGANCALRRSLVRSGGAGRRRGALASGDVGDDPGDGRLRYRLGARSSERWRRARAQVHGALQAGTPMQEIRLDRVFIGSCTNARIGDLRAAAEVIKGRSVASTVNAMVVPGSQQVGRRPSARASTRSSAPPASTGAPPAARCAWA